MAVKQEKSDEYHIRNEVYYVDWYLDAMGELYIEYLTNRRGVKVPYDDPVRREIKAEIRDRHEL